MTKRKTTFTLDELIHEVKKDHPSFTDEEVLCCVDVLEHEGYLKKLSRDIYQTTGKTP